MKEMYHALEGFLQRLREPGRDGLCALAAPSSRDWRPLLASRHLFEDVPLVLLLPDEDRDTVARAHLLRARFLAGPAGQVADALAVAERLLNRQAKKGETHVN